MKRIKKIEVMIYYDDGSSIPSLTTHYGEDGELLCFPVYKGPSGYSWLLVKEDKLDDAVEGIMG